MSIIKTISQIQWLKHILLPRISTREASGKFWHAALLTIGGAVLLGFLIFGAVQNAIP
jgi:hypothetical protein